MLHIPQHVEWVVQGHYEVVELVWSLNVSHDHVEDVREQSSDPVDEPASGGLLSDPLPV